MSAADLDLSLRLSLDVRPGESDPAVMLSNVLLLLALAGLVALLVLMWWLA